MLPKKHWVTKVLEIGLSILTFLRLMFPSFNVYYEEEMMGVFSTFDLLLLFWVPVLNVFGQWIKKQKFPDWVPPTPILVMLASFVICAIAGCLRCGKPANYLWVVTYMLENGLVISLIAICAYDCFRDFMKTQWLAIKRLYSKVIEFIKAKKEAKSEKV